MEVNGVLFLLGVDFFGPAVFCGLLDALLAMGTTMGPARAFAGRTLLVFGMASMVEQKELLLTCKEKEGRVAEGK